MKVWCVLTPRGKPILASTAKVKWEAWEQAWGEDYELRKQFNTSMVQFSLLGVEWNGFTCVRFDMTKI